MCQGDALFILKSSNNVHDEEAWGIYLQKYFANTYRSMFELTIEKLIWKWRENLKYSALDQLQSENSVITKGVETRKPVI